MVHQHKKAFLIKVSRVKNKHIMSHSEIIKKYSIVAKKSLWQNFLVNDGILQKIAEYIDLDWKNVVEVWPGYWALTEKIISKNPANLELVELDKLMHAILLDRLQNWDFKVKNTNLEINNADILWFEPNYNPYIVVANIPYYITSPILTRFFYQVKNTPSEMLILMQKDVADKIRKINGNKQSVLSLGVDFACSEIKEIVRVWAGNFVPAPKIESCVLYLKLKENIDQDLARSFMKIVKAWFSERRKKLSSNLVKQGFFTKENLSKKFEVIWLDDNVRAEELNIAEWLLLLK
jgi:16S rRNA (adenine1518-N6/adenine1519-N6)-dimethyltransferase